MNDLISQKSQVNCFAVVRTAVLKKIMVEKELAFSKATILLYLGEWAAPPIHKHAWLVKKKGREREREGTFFVHGEREQFQQVATQREREREKKEEMFVYK